ncbi:MAG TPA: universal stress protein [Candidatus Krumholzibacteria bacterium]|nr:universal stress protein [Candidatus Krumholzibacteria bacterium]
MLNFNVIVVTTDLSEYSLRALPYAVGLAERFKAKLKVVCVNEPALQVSDVAFVGIDPLISQREHSAAIRDALAKVVAGLPKTVDIEGKVLEGVAVDQVVKYASEINADLIVSCTHGRTGLSHVLMGSTAEALVRRSPCPVLTLKQPMPVAAAQRGA